MHRVIKNAEPTEDKEGLYDLISYDLINGFVSLLKESDFWIKDLEIVKDECECCCSDTTEIDEQEMFEYICKKANITIKTLEKIHEAQIEYLIKNGCIELKD